VAVCTGFRFKQICILDTAKAVDLTNLDVWGIASGCQWSRMRRNGGVHVGCHARRFLSANARGRVHHLSGFCSAEGKTEDTTVNQTEAVFRLFVFRFGLVVD
jgi:hypothetical protein